MPSPNRQHLFAQWAASYDDSVTSVEGFPFAGYAQVLAGVLQGANLACATIVIESNVAAGMTSARPYKQSSTRR
ncbi:MAG: hypothetical protein MUD01_19865 [Chloroflexaceae bacterium]|jgi:hypothetical protein|nr:hypothetical protein [Chloroflexaceae bacterium]